MQGEQLELFPLNLRDAFARQEEQKLLKEYEEELFTAHHNYECRTEVQVINPKACTWWWANQYWERIHEQHPGLLKKHNLYEEF